MSHMLNECHAHKEQIASLSPPPHTQSVFGKGLTTILNEYVATKTKGEII